MSSERFGGLRARIAAEAARLMYEEGVKQYFTAKRMAAKRMLGRVAGQKLRYRPSDLPSNGEIRDALLELASLAEGSRRLRRLFAMRVIALEAIRALLPFEPRLIGSVSTGHIRRGSATARRTRWRTRGTMSNCTKGLSAGPNSRTQQP